MAYQMKVLYSNLVVLATIMIVPLLMFSSTDDELVYAQQEENQIMRNKLFKK